MKLGEDEIGRSVKAWLEAEGWDVYPEVTSRGDRADIVAVRDGKVWVIECKVSMGLAVMGQALRWMGTAHFVSVAVPSSFRRRCVGQSLLHEKGIGVIEVRRYGSSATAVVVNDQHRRWREVELETRDDGKNWLSLVHSGHKCVDPGIAGGGYWTPYRQTMESLTDLVAVGGAVSLKTAIKVLDHHYANDKSAYSSLKNAVMWDTKWCLDITYEEGTWLIRETVPADKTCPS